MYSLWQDLSHGAIVFDLVTSILKFDIVMKNFNLGLNFLINFHMHMYFPCELWQDR